MSQLGPLVVASSPSRAVLALIRSMGLAVDAAVNALERHQQIGAADHEQAKHMSASQPSALDVPGVFEQLAQSGARPAAEQDHSHAGSPTSSEGTPAPSQKAGHRGKTKARQAGKVQRGQRRRLPPQSRRQPKEPRAASAPRAAKRPEKPAPVVDHEGSSIVSTPQQELLRSLAYTARCAQEEATVAIAAVQQRDATIAILQKKLAANAPAAAVALDAAHELAASSARLAAMKAGSSGTVSTSDSSLAHKDSAPPFIWRSEGTAQFYESPSSVGSREETSSPMGQNVGRASTPDKSHSNRRGATADSDLLGMQAPAPAPSLAAPPAPAGLPIPVHVPASAPAPVSAQPSGASLVASMHSMPAAAPPTLPASGGRAKPGRKGRARGGRRADTGVSTRQHEALRDDSGDFAGWKGRAEGMEAVQPMEHHEVLLHEAAGAAAAVEEYLGTPSQGRRLEPPSTLDEDISQLEASVSALGFTSSSGGSQSGVDGSSVPTYSTQGGP